MSHSMLDARGKERVEFQRDEVYLRAGTFPPDILEIADRMLRAHDPYVYDLLPPPNYDRDDWTPDLNEFRYRYAELYGVAPTYCPTLPSGDYA